MAFDIIETMQNLETVLTRKCSVSSAQHKYTIAKLSNGYEVPNYRNKYALLH